MLPGLRHGEWLALPKAEGWARRFGVGEYRRGDIVVFKPPRESQDWVNTYRGLPLPWSYRPYLVKRVVGVPGDTVAVQGGQLYINGKPVHEKAVTYWKTFCHDTTSVLANSVAASPQQPGQFKITVPPRHYFVMGDNRSEGGSLDSRVFGPVAVDDIAARAVGSVWPLMTPAQATPPCDQKPQPERRVRYSGTKHWNPRWLGR